MTALDILDTVWQRIGDPSAIVRLERDSQLRTGHYRIVVISGNIWSAGVAEPDDWNHPAALVAAVLDHVASERCAKPD